VSMDNGSAAADRLDPVSSSTATCALPAALLPKVDAAYGFLDDRVGEYGAGDSLRLPRSYVGGHLGSIGFTSSFVYDDALVVLASLARGGQADLDRAVAVGNALAWAQENDPQADGRIRNSYQPDPFVSPGGAPVIGSATASTGNQAWVGMAWVRLYQATGNARYLNSAHRMALWIEQTQSSSTGVPGYRGGRTDADGAILWKSTEHNLDVAAFFRLLAGATGQTDWLVHADRAIAFVHAMRSDAGYFYTGVTDDGATVNRTPVPLDAQAWTFLSTKRADDGLALDWAHTTLAATDGVLTGVSVSTADTSRVWLEGTAQLALAVRQRGGPGDAARADVLDATLWRAQAVAPNADGRGIVASSSDGLDSGFGDLVYASLHTGTTAWALFAALQVNPFDTAAPARSSLCSG
ncbi:MAG: hypothetical protein ABWX82_11880, partial [Leifsonia sp.]